MASSERLNCDVGGCDKKAKVVILEEMALVPGGRKRKIAYFRCNEHNWGEEDTSCEFLTVDEWRTREVLEA